MKRVGIGVFLIGNFYLLRLYVIDIMDYFSDKYNYDGIRYLEPLILADIFLGFQLYCSTFFWDFQSIYLGLFQLP